MRNYEKPLINEAFRNGYSGGSSGLYVHGVGMVLAWCKVDFSW
jgi:hypothetical protein